MEWVLILVMVGYGDSHNTTIHSTVFSNRELCIAAKSYYENIGTQSRLMYDPRDQHYRVRIDAQCFQKNYQKN